MGTGLHGDAADARRARARHGRRRPGRGGGPRLHPEAVGIWHETFDVPAGHIETLYGNGALIGLGAATGTIEAGRRGRGARERLGSSPS
ncbi:DUF4188 domain-containing protein [Janibacter cremeus]|uniref:monooxygenase family protein n=1 Tax=Janibacter cremeus TaxID=1285192 RepID=UPI0023F6D72B|nr:DUF4188 domain-containing protein [Janibacter cremeus]WEV77449.1 DUF4188 domain-containing protein [Janibacter cremeus]